MRRMTIEEYEKITWKKHIPNKSIEEKLNIIPQNNTGENIRNRIDKKWNDKKFNSNTSIKYWYTFKSNLEVRRYEFLNILKNWKKILDFFYEPKTFTLLDTIKYPLLWNRALRKITYTPDFLIILNDWKRIYEDTKSKAVAKKESYWIKKRLFLEKYIIWEKDLYFKEVFSSDDTYFFWIIKNF
jgi:hypothetical protein